MPADVPHAAEPIPGGAWPRVAVRDGRIALPRGVHLDLGGIAKGMAVDASVARLRAAGVPAGLVSAGGDLAVWGAPPGRRAWPIGLDELPLAPPVPLRRGAMATTGCGRRRWSAGGRAMHHVLDPRTGAPADTGLRAVSVVAGTCREAEAAATAAFVRGVDGGAEFLEARGLPGLFVPEDGPPLPVGQWPAPRGRERVWASTR